MVNVTGQIVRYRVNVFVHHPRDKVTRVRDHKCICYHRSVRNNLKNSVPCTNIFDTFS